MHENVVELLVSCGADLEAGDVSGLRALHYAAMDGYENVVRVLVASGADLDAVCKYGSRPIEWGKGKKGVEEELVKGGARV